MGFKVESVGLTSPMVASSWSGVRKLARTIRAVCAYRPLCSGSVIEIVSSDRTCGCGEGLKHPWLAAGPPNHIDDKVDSDQEVVNKELSLW